MLDVAFGTRPITGAAFDLDGYVLDAELLGKLLGEVAEACIF